MKIKNVAIVTNLSHPNHGDRITVDSVDGETVTGNSWKTGDIITLELGDVVIKTMAQDPNYGTWYAVDDETVF